MAVFQPVVSPLDFAPSPCQVGLGICYDLRFPEMSLTLAQEGAELLTYPSAFTVATGIAHWEVSRWDSNPHRGFEEE